MKAYRGTRTGASQSQDGIRRVLSKYGADGVQFTEDWTGKKLIVRFLYSPAKIQHSIVFVIPIPDIDDTTPRRGRKKSIEVLAKLKEQQIKQIWRALYWAIKARMESVDFGIETFEEAFLSHFEVPGTNKQVGEYLIPRIQSGRLSLPEPKFKGD